MRMAKVAVLFDRGLVEKRWRFGLNCFEFYAAEVLAHAGIPFQAVCSTEEALQVQPDLIVAAIADETEANMTFLSEYMKSGGAVVAAGNLNRMAASLGCAPVSVSGPGYARFAGVSGEAFQLRYIKATPWAVIGTADAGFEVEQLGSIHASRPDGKCKGGLVQRFSIGNGLLERWSVDLFRTIVEIQQGTGPVLDDAPPAPDGWAQTNEGILKAEDRCALDWEQDRTLSVTGIPYFPTPYADLWREVWIGRLLKLAVDRGLTLPFTDYWPEGVDNVAMVSLDSDQNKDEHAVAALDALEQCGIKTTWCIIKPGYSPPIYERVIEQGHELAFHFNGLEAQNGAWKEEEFAGQLKWLKSVTGLERFVSNKNHYTRFEGWGEAYRWCETYGIASDETRGPSKDGNTGFLFGTCQPYFPIAWWDEQNRFYDVLEIGFLTQDLGHNRVDNSMVAPFLEQVGKVRGVAHFLFHQNRICNNPRVRNELIAFVEEARRRGFVFWTGKQINDWVRMRRQVNITGINDTGEVQTEEALPPGVAVRIPLGGADNETAGEPAELRFGIRCRKAVAANGNA